MSERRLQLASGSYARAIVRSLERIHGAPVLLSPRDYGHVEDWHARGVPIALVLEEIDAAAAPRRGRPGRTRRITLAYVARAVEAAWGVVLAGRMVDPSERRARGSDPAAVRRRWLEAAGRAGAASPLERVLTRSVKLLDDGEDPAAIDLALDEAIVEAAPSAVVRAIETRVDVDLHAFAARMSPAGLIATRRRAIVDRLRVALELPRLSNGPSAGRKRAGPA